MEELFKTLNIRTIEYLHLAFIDNNGNFKEIKIDYPSEKSRKDMEE